MKKNVPKEFLTEYKEKRESLESALGDLKSHINLKLTQLKRQEGTRARLTDHRIKRPGKIWKKALEHEYSPSEAFEKIVDILGLRIVCNNISDAQSVVGMLKNESGYLEITNVKNMVVEPRDDGYRAIHIHTLIPLFRLGQTTKLPCEIQVRTLSQDTWARLSRADLYGKKFPKIISELTKSLSTQLSAIDEMAQTIRDELNKPAEKAQDIKGSDPISPQRLALLYEQEYNESLWEWSLHDWALNLEDAEVGTIKEAKDLIRDSLLRKKLDEIAMGIRDYPLEDSEWVANSAKVAAELNEDEGIKAVEDDIRSEWNEITSIALREILPSSIEDFIEELEFSLTSTKEAEDSFGDIKNYFSVLGCMSSDMYGAQSIDVICAVEMVLDYYKDKTHEERLTELILSWESRYL
jgi:ppGpp synthetase/RelA/SpoT-type nucleotidyltranferase